MEYMDLWMMAIYTVTMIPLTGWTLVVLMKERHKSKTRRG